MAHTSYLFAAFDKKFKVKTIDYVCRQLEKIDCDAIAFSGMSGALIAPIIAYKTGKNIILVRKSKDDSHSSYKIEASSTKCKKYVIIDDLISTGTTVEFIIRKMWKDYTFQNSVCVGVILYNGRTTLGKYSSRTIEGVPIYSKRFYA
jgi:adenine/guanine phosphoribosyltransferase-like PRPP-binding protein